MNYIPPFYNTEEVIDFVDEIIRDYDIKEYRDVSFCDKKTLCSFLLDAENESNCSDWMESFLRKSTGKKFSKFMNETNSSNGIDLLADIAGCIVSHYENLMEEIFEERISEYEASKEKQGFME